MIFYILNILRDRTDRYIILREGIDRLKIYQSSSKLIAKLELNILKKYLLYDFNVTLGHREKLFPLSHWEWKGLPSSVVHISAFNQLIKEKRLVRTT